MLRGLFSTYNPFYFLLLGVLALLLRWPAFQPGLIGDHTALYLAAADRLLTGHTLYQQVWITEPPLMPWLFAGLKICFGSYTPVAAQLLAAIVVLLLALLLNQLYGRFRLSSYPTVLPSFLLVVMASLPWYELELGPELLLALLYLLCLRVLLFRLLEQSPSWRMLFLLGLAAACLVGIAYQGIFLVLALLITYALLRSAQLSQMLTFWAGFITFLLIVTLVLYWRGGLKDYYQLGVLAGLELTGGAYAGWLARSQAHLLEALLFWGLLVAMGLAGLVTIRSRFYSIAVRTRKVESAMAVWLLAAVLSIFFAAEGLRFERIMLAIPPLVFYTVYLVENVLAPAARPWAIALLLLMPLATGAIYLVLRSPKQYQALCAALPEATMLAPLYHKLHPPAVEGQQMQRFAQLAPGHTLWVLGAGAATYARWQAHCPLKYLSFVATKLKLGYALRVSPAPTLTAPESLEELYRALATNPPECILDEDSLFPLIQYKLPLLLQHYQPIAWGKATLYYLPQGKNS